MTVSKIRRHVALKIKFVLLAIIQITFLILFLSDNGFSESKTADALFEMSLDDLLNQTVVTASKSPQELKKTPATVRVVSAQQIKDRGYLTIEEVLCDIPGIQFRNIQGFNSYVFIRGVPNQNNLIQLLVDGIEINELNSGGFYAGGQFNLESIKRIEVVYGPASALYGTNAMSGIINIITWDPEEKNAQVTKMNASAGNFDTWTADFRSGAYNTNKKIGYTFSGMYKTTEKADLKGRDGDNNWTGAMDNFEKDISFDGKLRFKELVLGVLYQDKKASRATNYKTIGSDKLDNGTLWHITFMNLWLKHKFDISERLKLNSTLFYRDTTVEDDTVAYIDKAMGMDPGQQVGYYRPNEQFGVEEQFTYDFNKSLNFIGGIAWKKEWLSESFSRSFSASENQDPPAPEKPDQVKERTVSIYLQSRYNLFESVQLTIGIRADDSTVYDNITTPRCGLVYNRGAFIGKLLYSEAYRAPKPWDYTYGTGNTGLQPEEMESWEGVLGYHFGPHVNADISIYRNKIDQLLTLDTINNRWVNQGQVETNGCEITLNYIKGNLSAYLNYTYTDSDDDTGGQMDEIAYHGANAGMTFSPDNHWKFHIRGNYTGKRKNPQIITSTGEDEIDDAFVISGDIGYEKFKHFDFHLSVKNAFDTTYYHTSNRPPERYRQPQRMIIFKTTYAF